MAILIKVLEMCKVTKNDLGCCNNSKMSFELAFCLVFIKPISLEDNVKKADSAPVIIKESTNNINKIKTIEVITAGGICVCKSIDEKQIVFRNAIF